MVQTRLLGCIDSLSDRLVRPKGNLDGYRLRYRAIDIDFVFLAIARGVAVRMEVLLHGVGDGRTTFGKVIVHVGGCQPDNPDWKTPGDVLDCLQDRVA